MPVLVNAPLAFQRKLVEGADRSTTHHAKTDQPAAVLFVRQPSRPNPARSVAKSGRAAGKGTGSFKEILAIRASGWPEGSMPEDAM